MNSSFKNIFQYQLWQGLSAVVLVIVMSLIINLDPEITAGSLWGVTTHSWFLVAVIIPILHQLYVWLIWRLELYQNTFSNYFGEKLAFKFYKIGFAILFLSRLVFIIFLAVSNQDSLHLNPVVSYLLLIIITPLVIYLFYSVKKYFTIDRAFGIDHFIKNYNEPYVKKGIFRFTNNAMYIFGLMILYIPGLLLFSKAALLAAAFNHLYIWAHYFCTEKPDMQKIYNV